MRPTLELRGANIDRDHVIATLCGAGGAAPCITLRLGDPDVGCAGDVAGPWCLTFLDGAPRPDIASVVREALATNDGAPVWTKLVALQPRCAGSFPSHPRCPPPRTSGSSSDRGYAIAAAPPSPPTSARSSCARSCTTIGGSPSTIPRHWFHGSSWRRPVTRAVCCTSETR